MVHERRQSLLDGLSPGEARAVLQRLVIAHPELRSEVESVVATLLGGLDLETIAEQVEAELLELDLEALWGRAGKQPFGYVEPCDAAIEMVEQTIEPFAADLGRHARMGLHATAIEACKGILLGIHRAEEEGFELLQYIPDGLSDFADLPLRALAESLRDTKGARSIKQKARASISAFCQASLPGWEGLRV